jgi:hypothetical protein
MISKNMIKELFGYSFINYYFSTHNEMNHLHQMIHHHQDGTIRIKRQKVYDEIHGN